MVQPALSDMVPSTGSSAAVFFVVPAARLLRFGVAGFCAVASLVAGCCACATLPSRSVSASKTNVARVFLTDHLFSAENPGQTKFSLGVAAILRN